MTATHPIPDHVPAHLVRDYPIIQGRYVQEDPYKTIIPALHDWPPVFWATNAYPGERPAWVIRRAADLRDAYSDTEHFSSQGGNPFAAIVGESWNMVPTELDPPFHTAVRSLLNPLFSPPRMRALEDKVRDAARHYVGLIKDRGHCDFIRDFAFPFPVSVFLDLMDMPHDKTALFLQWEHDLLHEGDLGTIGNAVRAVNGYMRDVIAARRERPGDDLISHALKTGIQGRPFTDDELIGYTFNLFIGGLDTVTTNMGLHFRHLAENPAHQQRLRDDPDFIPVALEELLRAYAATSTFRTCVKERTLNGVTIKPGDKVLTSTILACRDPEEYDRPNEVILDRRPTQILTFGHGPHFCLGVHLAKREMRVALREFLAAIPPFSIAPGAIIKTHLGGMVQPTALPLVWD
ncbi:MAG: cytochrome P450 [Pseudomonadota bacterium]|nr:cytochrome P450 [Pseudomonadota bacterium]